MAVWASMSACPAGLVQGMRQPMQLRGCGLGWGLGVSQRGGTLQQCLCQCTQCGPATGSDMGPHTRRHLSGREVMGLRGLLGQGFRSAHLRAVEVPAKAACGLGLGTGPLRSMLKGTRVGTAQGKQFAKCPFWLWGQLLCC